MYKPPHAILSIAFLLLCSCMEQEGESDVAESESGSALPDSSELPPSSTLQPVYETLQNHEYGNLSCELFTSGGLCEQVIFPSLPVLTNLSRALQPQVKDDLDKIFYVLDRFGSSQQCFSKAVPILCLFTFPYCDPAFREVVYQPTCRHDCRIMRDFICPGEWIQMKNLESLIDFGNIDPFNCELLPPANAGDAPMCISILDGGIIAPSLLSGDECYSGNGRGYTGNISVTASGYTCQVWTSHYPHQYYLSPHQYPELSGDHNHCRNPGGKGFKPWCFTTNRTKRWEYCDVKECAPGPICEPYSGSLCRTFGTIGMDYVFINTSFGKQSNYETEIDMLQETLRNFPNCETAMLELVCHVNFPVCDLSSSVPRPRKVCKSYCNKVKRQCADFYEHLNNFLTVSSILPLVIPQCDEMDSDVMNAGNNPECYKPIPQTETNMTNSCYDPLTNGTNYNGTVNTTVSGSICQHWDATYPHFHSFTSLFRRYLEGHNYCRNPDGRGQRPWCYTLNVSERWEYCNVEECVVVEEVSEPNKDRGIDPPLIGGVAGGVAFILLVIAVAATVICARIRHKSKTRTIVLNSQEKGMSELKPVNNQNAYITNPKLLEEEEDELDLDPSLPFIERDKLVYLCDLGEGHFGTVLKAEALNLVPGEETTIVAVKVLKEGKLPTAKKEFYKEACLMNGFKHKNIVKLLGVCLKEEPLCMVFEYMVMGDLHSFLRQNAPSHTFSFPQIGPKTLPNGLSIVQMVRMSIDIAAGLEYLSIHHYIHRDLATRNCLVDSQLCVKLSDFGLSQDIYVKDYFRLGDTEVLPIRWMPPEAIMFSTFSTESDVWSFGIVLWEVFSYAMQPYYGMSNEEVVHYVKDGKVPKQPAKCPEEIYDLMLDCWNADPKERPKAEEIHQGLKRWTPELSAMVEVKSKHPEYQNMSVILHWATTENNEYWNEDKDSEHQYMGLDLPNTQEQANHSNHGDQKMPYDKLDPQ